MMVSGVHLIQVLFFVTVSKATDLQPQSRLYSQSAVSTLWPFALPQFFTIFCQRWKLQWNFSTKVMMSSIAARNPLSWLVSIVSLGWSKMGWAILMYFQNGFKCLCPHCQTTWLIQVLTCYHLPCWHALNKVCIYQSSCEPHLPE